ncbi:hypothetical protein predicted by Glimmer/Critica [Sorangium cellulosum So ce56]|uniref:Uncharacterized protein n=1 Tax=Sorangium cellulosum (strain So ce56) TaxID=448385 RepID=A9GGE3_SORC5|nr:hypothetical protein [Sorangium cellulosum]CAN96316.1 hypothetical protein predicted by Glimmer/Critica [Sorangium cellulosum So ce56]
MTKAPKWLDRASRRSGECEWTLGAALDEYCRTEGKTREQLAALLGCRVDSLDWLSLCRKPDPERFAEDVTRIAERFQIEGPRLAQIIRRVDAVAVLRRATHEECNEPMLLAARDRDKGAGG